MIACGTYMRELDYTLVPHKEKFGKSFGNTFRSIGICTTFGGLYLLGFDSVCHILMYWCSRADTRYIE